MTRSWWENEDIIRQFRDWLTQTEEEIEALDESSHHAESSEGSDGAEFSVHHADERAAPPPELPNVGLLQLVEAFTALRHELKLQTKGTRNLEASVEQSLAGLDSASRIFQSIQTDERAAAERATLPMIEALIELDEGLLRAARAFQATHGQMTRAAPAKLRQNLDTQFEALSWWRRPLARRWHAEMREATCQALAQSIDEEFAILMEGFKLIQTRLARTLEEHDVRRFDETGGLVDPHRMSVVELVADVAAPPETVVEVVRPGYVWGERVVRFAEVRPPLPAAPRFNGAPSPRDVADACQDAGEGSREGLGQITQ